MFQDDFTPTEGVTQETFDGIAQSDECIPYEMEATAQDYMDPVNAKDKSAPDYLQLLHDKFGIKRSWRDIEPGAYLCEVQYVAQDTNANETYLVFDISEGPFEGVFSASDCPVWPHSITVSDNKWSFDRFMQAIDAIAKSNPGFDAYKAIFEDDFDLFCNKLLGVVFYHREYLGKKDNKPHMGLRVMKTIPISDIASEPVPDPVYLPKESE